VNFRTLALPAEPKDRLVFALDVDDLDEAERLIKELAPHVGMFKVGPRVFTRYGEQVTSLIQDARAKLFLDLKFHDIPETVAGAAREVVRLRADMFTVHALGGAEMMRRASGALSKMTIIPGMPHPLCIAVTVLTSHNDDDLKTLGFSASVPEQVARLAKLALDNGAAGVVTSGHELRQLKTVLPKQAVYVVPGIRGPSDSPDDQARTMGAKEAVELGATYVVVGRPIRSSKHPAGAAKAIVDEIAQARL
jgi:orotidine-5'-phosphate decarboxylase